MGCAYTLQMTFLHVSSFRAMLKRYAKDQKRCPYTVEFLGLMMRHGVVLFLLPHTCRTKNFFLNNYMLLMTPPREHFPSTANILRNCADKNHPRHSTSCQLAAALAPKNPHGKKQSPHLVGGFACLSKHISWSLSPSELGEKQNESTSQSTWSTCLRFA